MPIWILDDSLIDLRVERSANLAYDKRIKELEEYAENDSLYIGHVHIKSRGHDVYFTDSDLGSHQLSEHSFLINVHAAEVKQKRNVDMWRNPKSFSDVSYSRNIQMENRQVLAVDIVMDDGSEYFSDIQDNYLRRALIRNKEKKGAQKIIQTIQEKQDKIRTMSANERMIVQGCAGSGKTMVLLYRIKYLLYNDMLANSDYIFLIPSQKFKNFISSFLADQKISSGNVLTYQAYYQYLQGKDIIDEDDTSELVFSSEFLSSVYSDDFIRNNYTRLFEKIGEQADKLIEFTEPKLNYLIETESQHFKTKLISLEKEIKTNLNKALEKVVPFISFKKIEIEDIDAIIKELNEAYTTKKEILSKIMNENDSISIPPTDERIVNHPELNKIHSEISQEENLIKKSSTFTKQLHLDKLAILQQRFTDLYSAVEAELIMESRKVREEKTNQAQYVFENVTVFDVADIIESIINIKENLLSEYLSLNEYRNNSDDYLKEKYDSQITALTSFIAWSTDLYSVSSEASKKLESASIELVKGFSAAKKLIEAYDSFLSEDEKENIKKQCNLFNRTSDKDFLSRLEQNFFTICCPC